MVEGHTAARRHVIVVEDDALVRGTIEEILAEEDIDVTSLDSGAALIGLISSLEQAPLALITDVKLGGAIDGFEAAQRLRERFDGLPVIFVSGDLRSLVRLSGPHDLCLMKPFSAEVLVTLLASFSP